MKLLGSITLTAGLLIAVFATLYVFSKGVVPATTFDLLTATVIPPPTTAIPTMTSVIPTTTSVIPTKTPIPPGVTPAGIPPTLPALLPTPLPGNGHVTGRALCNGIPKAFQYVFLIWIEGDSYSILQSTATDEAGRWFFSNLPPRTYAVTGEMPTSMPTQLFVINADQITDLDLNLAPSLCN